MTSIPPKHNKRKPSIFGVLKELRRYGWKWSDFRYCVYWAVIAIILAYAVPAGQGKDIFQFVTLHVTLLGFGATIFGFTILGGKDDFFEPIMESRKNGLNTLRDMVLILFFPLVLHAVACAVLGIRILFPEICGTLAVWYLWRWFYSFFAIWATAQSAFATRYLFVLAITRLVWRNKEIQKAKKERQKGAGPIK
jgi:hypothetical protein